MWNVELIDCIWKKHSQHVVAHHFLTYWHNQSILSELSRLSQTSSHPATLQFSCGIPRCFQATWDTYIIPPATFGLTPGSHLSSACLENLQREMPRRQPNLTSIVSFWHAGAEALFWDVRAPRSVSTAEPRHPLQETRFSHAFSHYPDFITIDEG